MTARSQAQNVGRCRRAGRRHRAGLRRLTTNRSASAPAVQSAMAAAHAERRHRRGRQRRAGRRDVPARRRAALNNRVRVHVYRTGARGNPVRHADGPVLRRDAASNITATATAEASPANAMTCVKPFTIPDKWIERQTPPWDANDTFDMYDNHRQPAGEPGHVHSVDAEPATRATTPIGTRASADDSRRDRATTSTRASTSRTRSAASPAAPSTRGNIANCNTTVMGFGDLLMQEPGDMIGPTNQGIDDADRQGSRTPTGTRRRTSW